MATRRGTIDDPADQSEEIAIWSMFRQGFADGFSLPAFMVASSMIGYGGVIKWVDNGYAFGCIDWLQEHLEATGPVGKKIWEMLRPFLEEFMDEHTGEIQQDDEDDEGNWSQASECSDELSTRFYDLEDEWHPEVYAYLARLEESATVVVRP